MDASDSPRRDELASFLRSRRERLTPEDVGLPVGRRRRTPGLRREEVAQLAAIGVTWYTWLEQARDIQVSAEVLDAIARTLRLDRSERNHLFSLAGSIDPTPANSYSPVSEAIRLMIDQLDPFPSSVQNNRFDVLAYNRSFERLFCDLDAVPAEDRNMIWLAFTHEQVRATMGDLDLTLRLMTAKFRASMTANLGEPAWKALLNRLQTESAEFRELWERHEVMTPTTARKHYRHREVGDLHLLASNLWFEPNPASPHIVTYSPSDEATAAKLPQLVREPLPAL
ncbi:helix-turn-helix transcriptional regulator [Kribbella monticola]|uniref:helix-turn-helix transcriptional regulator n=1 Tax=Kribbella monticola TaxID=2185285 RepID=UPI000DD3728A|nr:helix-turn-helix transcriptional regulator [Kribbella monticola]